MASRVFMEHDAGATRSEPVVGDEGAELPEQPRSFEECYQEHHQRVFTALCLVTGNRDEAEEIMQDAFLRIFERWDRLGPLEDLEGYVFRTAMNVFRNRYRRRVVAARSVVAPAPIRDDLAAVEARDEVLRLLRGLNPRQRAAVLLTAFFDHTSEEAGRMLGIKASTVRALTTQARAQMKEKVGTSE